MSFNEIPRAFKRVTAPESSSRSTVVEKKHYDLEASSVDMEVKLFSPEKKRNDNAIIFLPGWSMTADSKSSELFGTSLSKESGANTHVLTTRLEQRGANQPEDPLYEEAQAIAIYIQEKGLKHITLVGHSQGGDRALDVATLLQNNPDLTLDGLILINPVGLYEQGGVELATKFAGNSAFTIASVDKEINRHGINPATREKAQDAIAPALQAGNDVVSGIAKEAITSKFDYPARFKSEVNEMAQLNRHTKELTVPIVIVTGMEDSVSDPSSIASAPEVATLKADLEDSTEETVKQDATLRAREAYLKETLFPQSPYVRMLVPEKHGVHALPFLRPDTTAKTALYMLERFNRNVPEEKY